jgi:hypothetical protein
MYIEEIEEKYSTSKFHFLNNRAEFDSWKKRGYLTSDEFEEAKLAARSAPQKTPPGAPVESKPSPPDPKKVIQILRTWWSRMSWKEQNQIFSRCLRQSTSSEGTTKSEIDMILYRDMKLKTCLKKWDLQDDSGNEVPVSDAIIDSLVPEVAQELLSNFEAVTEASEEDLKN